MAYDRGLVEEKKKMELTKKADSVIQSQENIIWSDQSKTSFRNNKDRNVLFYSRRLESAVGNVYFL